MGAPIELEGKRVCAKLSVHESGFPSIVFHPFRPSIISSESIRSLILDAQTKLGTEISIFVVCLDSDQESEKTTIENMGFKIDGIEYGWDLDKIRLRNTSSCVSFFRSCELRLMRYEADIESVVAIEKRVHAADPSSRVNFETPEAERGMREYYRKASEGKGIHLLLHNAEIIGFAGFMPDKTRANAIHVSSIAIDLKYQGQGLMFPMLGACMVQPAYEKYLLLTGVTTTSKLIAAGRKHGARILGYSLVKDQRL